MAKFTAAKLDHSSGRSHWQALRYDVQVFKAMQELPDDVSNLMVYMYSSQTITDWTGPRAHIC
jgi:hypothetical protein